MTLASFKERVHAAHRDHPEAELARGDRAPGSTCPRLTPAGPEPFRYQRGRERRRGRGGGGVLVRWGDEAFVDFLLRAVLDPEGSRRTSPSSSPATPTGWPSASSSRPSASSSTARCPGSSRWWRPRRRVAAARTAGDRGLGRTGATAAAAAARRIAEQARSRTTAVDAEQAVAAEQEATRAANGCRTPSAS
ncbi:hypothetical protein HBB16_18310 [Pseudonocardia sp. MCCB 268]|nr:hypothetical protein [Pseudonocardia cytotoxica]